MKVSATLWLLFVLSVCKAQSVDSTAVKLEQYKALYQSNSINNNEYVRLKARLLHIPIEMTMNLDSVHARALKARYHSRILTGSCLVGIGLGVAVVGGITTSVLEPFSNNAFSIGAGPFPFVCVTMGGCAMAIVGAVFLGLGTRDRTLYYNNYMAITLTGTGNEVGLACNF